MATPDGKKPKEEEEEEDLEHCTQIVAAYNSKSSIHTCTAIATNHCECILDPRDLCKCDNPQHLLPDLLYFQNSHGQ